MIVAFLFIAFLLALASVLIQGAFS